MVEIAEHAHGMRQVGRADEQHVHAVNGRNGFHGLNRGWRLDLDDGDQRRRPRHIGTEVGAVSAGAVRKRHAAHARRRIAHGGDGSLRFGRRLDAWEHDSVGAEIEDPMDALPRRRFHAHNGKRSTGRQSLNLGQHVALIAGAVLEIDQPPVVAGVGHQFSGRRRSERKKTAQYRLAMGELFAEQRRRVLGHECLWKSRHFVFPPVAAWCVPL